jgi:hypothetical protein
MITTTNATTIRVDHTSQKVSTKADKDEDDQNGDVPITGVTRNIPTTSTCSITATTVLEEKDNDA